MTRDAPDWAEVHNPLPVPCLVVIQLACGSWANHVGVHIGNNQFIHAYSKTGKELLNMKRVLVLFLLIFLLTSCGISYTAVKTGGENSAYASTTKGNYPVEYITFL